MKKIFLAFAFLGVIAVSAAAQIPNAAVPMVPNTIPTLGRSANSQSGNYPTVAGDCNTFIAETTGANNYTVTLMSAASAGKNCIQIVQKLDTGAGTVTVYDGTNNRAYLFTGADFAAFYSDGSAWQAYDHKIAPVTFIFNAGVANTLGTIVGGSSYTNGTYNGVTLTGGGCTTAPTANITVSGAVVSAVTLATGGAGCAPIPGNALTTTAANIGGTGSGFSVPIASITATFTTPPLAANISGLVIGAGAGAGSGGTAATSVAHTGGGAAAGGEAACYTWPASLFGNSASLTIAAGGIGGVGQPSSTSAGSAGNPPTVGTALGVWLQILGTNGGVTGAGGAGQASTTSGGGGNNVMAASANCGYEGVTQGSSSTANISQARGQMSGSGSPGGSFNASHTVFTPGPGTTGSTASPTPTLGGIAGTTGSVAGGPGASIAGWVASQGCVAGSNFGGGACVSGGVPVVAASYTQQLAGGGGGGGYGNQSAAGGAGGNGGCPGGGGGGGSAADNTFTSGAGGGGCQGETRVSVGF